MPNIGQAKGGFNGLQQGVVGLEARILHAPHAVVPMDEIRAKANINGLQQNGALVRQMDRQANCKRQIEQGRHPSFRTVLIPAHKLSAATGPDLRCYTLYCQRSSASRRRTRVTP